MTNLSITAKTNVDECIQIDYITILTKDGKEIDLNWEYSHYTPFEPFNSPHSILKSMRKFETFYENVFFDDEEEGNPVSVSFTNEYDGGQNGGTGIVNRFYMENGSVDWENDLKPEVN